MLPLPPHRRNGRCADGCGVRPVVEHLVGQCVVEGAARQRRVGDDACQRALEGADVRGDARGKELRDAVGKLEAVVSGALNNRSMSFWSRLTSAQGS